MGPGVTKNVLRERLDELSTLLQTALHLSRELAYPLCRKVLEAFGRMPPEDRPVLASILERESSFRAETTDDAAILTGYRARMNPGARLYVRTFEKAPTADMLPLTHEEMVFSSLRSARLMQAVLAPSVHESWRNATLEAFEHLAADERARIARVLRELLELLATSERGAPPGTHG